MKWWLLIILPLLFGACSSQNSGTATGISWHPPLGFQEKDLIGIWDSLRYDVKETIALHDDNTFVQDFIEKSDRFQSQGQWRIEYRSSGCIYVHLDGGLFFYVDPVIRKNGNRYPSDQKPVRFWDVCEGRQIEMPDEAVLIIGSDSSFPRRIKLVHMRGGDDDLYDQFFRLNIDTP